MKLKLLIIFGYCWGVAVAAAPAPAPAPTVPWPPPTPQVSWEDPAAVPHPAGAVTLRVLTFNDFHGNLQTPAAPDGKRPAGGAAVLAAYLEAERARDPTDTLIIHAGDLLGASPPITRLLQNEPAIQFLNLLAGDQCRYSEATRLYAAAGWQQQPNPCHVIGTPGNHEFDAGPEELLRLLNGGNAKAGPFLENPWRGSRVPYVCANVRDRRTGRTLLPPYTVVVIHGIPVGVIGAVLRDSLAVAGRTGTLELRMRGTRAAGNCQGKTGTLTGVSNLVGYCQAADGHTLAFAIFTDGIPTETAHTFQDNMTITLADY